MLGVSGLLIHVVGPAVVVGVAVEKAWPDLMKCLLVNH